MQMARVQPAELDKAGLDRVRALEHDLGDCVVAYEPRARYAELTPPELERLQAAERELGVILLAYDCRPQ